MTMQMGRVLAVVAGTVLCVGFAAISASAATPSGVTIHVRHGDDRPGQRHRLYGYVFSRDSKRCAEDRHVHVYRQRGKRPDFRSDEIIARDLFAHKDGRRYKWRLLFPNERIKVGKRYYARISKESGCERDRSRTIRIKR